MVNEPEEHLTTTEARGASNAHMTRYVLVIGTALVVVLFVIAFTLGG